jgi:uncharacterized protein (TIGR04255 family)
MENKLPKTLKDSPIVEAILDFRFESNFPEEVLAGMVFARYKDEVTAPFEKLPSHQIPEQIRRSDPNLRFVPLYRIVRNNILIQVGTQSISIINVEPYLGWLEFEKYIRSFIETLREINVIEKVSRIGLRYLNFIECDAVDVCNVSLNNTVKYERIQINNTEVYKKQDLNIKVQIANGANLNKKSGLITGSVLDIDVFKDSLSLQMTNDILNVVEEMHVIEKEIFVSILKADYLKQLGPIYE